MLRGVITVDLGPHLESDGSAGVKAENAAWSVLAATPTGWAVNVDLGAATWVTDRLLVILQDGLHEAAGVQVTGQNAAAVHAVLQRLRENAW